MGSHTLIQISYVFEFCSAIVIFQIAAISYYAYSDRFQKRVFIYFVAFLLSGILMGQYLFNFRWMATEYGFSYSVISRIILCFGLLLGGSIKESSKYATKSRKIRMLSLLVVLVFFSVAEIYSTVAGPLHYIIRFIDRYMMQFEFTISIFLIGVIGLAIRRYERTKNIYVMRYCIGLTGLLVAQLVRMSTIRFNDVDYVGYSLLQFLGFVFLLIAYFKFFVTNPRDDLMKAESQIKLYADNLEKIIDKRTDEMREANHQLISEIEYAKSIQQSLLPQRRLNFRNVMFVSEYFPCERLSGDFYDIYRIDDDHIGMYVLDVSGHGISAALMTMFCNNYVKSTEKLIQRYRGLKPHRNLKHFYEEFNKMSFPDEMHMVIFFASYNLVTNELTYSSGGMNCYPILVKKSGEWSYLDQSEGFPICKMSQFIVPEYKSAKLLLEKGDRIIFYTDGLIDKAKNGILGEEELIEVMISCKDKNLRLLNKTLKEILRPILNDIDDDVTYFIMEV